MHWRLLQIADSTFPAGGFAHSAGLEAAFQAGAVRSVEQLDAYVRAHLWNAGTASLPFVSAAHQEPESHASLDAELQALLSNHVANRASRTQGRAWISTCENVFQRAPIAEAARRVRAREVMGHLAPLFGAALAALGVARVDAQALHLHFALRGVVSAAVRLGIVGPHEAARLQARQAPTLDAVLSACADLAPVDAAHIAPVADLFGATHDRLYARLFQS